MLILTAQNVTGGLGQDADDLAKYDVWIGINHHAIWVGEVDGHVRDAGAAELLRKIADAMENCDSVSFQEGPIQREFRRVLGAPKCPKCGKHKLSCSAGCTWEIK